MTAKNLLVVDFDFFFPVAESANDPMWPLYDWGHSEGFAPDLQDDLWTLRAAGFLRAGLGLPALDPASYNTFWNTMRLSAAATLYYADSNVHALDPHVRPGVKTVWLFDAHHDAGYQRLCDGKTFTCENWLLWYAWNGCEVHMRYPRWRSAFAFANEPEPQAKIDRATYDVTEKMPVFDRVFVCRSGAWVPPWVDEHFYAFLDAAPCKRLALERLRARAWDREAAEALVAQDRAVQELTARKGTA
jgi:hypothetical protein